MADLLEKCLKDAQPIQKKMDANMMAIRHLDMQFHLKESETNQKLLDLVTNWKKLSKDEQKQNYEQIEKCFAEAKEISNQKIGIASETYEFIDNFIRRLDKDAAKLNGQIRQQERQQLVNEQTPEPETGPSSSASRKRRGTMQSTSSSSQKRGSAAGRKQVGEQLSLANTYIDDDIPVTNVSSEMTLVSHGDMPVDPNEPRYCICQQVSFGSMVCCDNPKCRLEWFHFSCVGLTSSPKGKWFCPECSGGKDAKKPQLKKTPKRGKNVQE